MLGTQQRTRLRPGSLLLRLVLIVVFHLVAIPSFFKNRYIF
jgi:hypothetical protein